MKIEEKVKSVRFRLFGILSLSTIVVISIIILFNSVASEYLFIYSKTKTALNLSKDINTYYSSIMQPNINMELKQIEAKHDLQILIADNFSEIVYSSNREIPNSITKLENSTTAKTIYSDDNTVIKDSNDNNRFMMLVSYLDNGYTLYVKIPVASIVEYVKISNRTLMVIGLAIAIIYGIIASIVSKKFTNRILKLNNITKKMSKLDFSEKYQETGLDDEINTLGKNINTMSDKLETTIGQLRQNNNELEKDIEEKSKIDEMRKQFISDVSHELKTPIALIQGYAEGLLENVNNDEESRKFYAEVIIDESNKMDKMVKELLELMKLEQKDKKFEDVEFDLTELINEELRRQTKILKEKKITVDFDKTKKVKVFSAPEYMEQVVNNYLTNAIKNCKKKDDEKKIVIRTEKTKKNKIRLFVYNTGDKIDEAIKDKIWNRFYKGDTSRNRDDGGTGIGLAIVRAIMNNYKNEYGVKNYKNGVEFYCDINKSK